MPAIPLTDSSTMCGLTAYKYLRTPPRYLGICPPLPQCEQKTPCRELARAPLVTEILGLPIHVLTDNAANRSQSNTVRYHVMGHELPYGSTRTTPHGVQVASPELTLFTLSRCLTFNQLVMAMYELCGRFTLFSPTDPLEKELAACGAIGSNDGWSCVRDPEGKPTSLWTRPPLTTVSGLKSFARALTGLRGAKLFSRAVDCISGVTASPLEAQLSMLLWIDPDYGGWGYRNFENNVPIGYTKEARSLTGSSHAEVDLRVSSPDGTREWMLECQGRIVHDRIGAGTKDALRVTALQVMGRGVTLVTSDQIWDPSKFEVLRDMLARNLKIKWCEKTTRQLLAENDLRAEIFTDWVKLSDEPCDQELQERRLKNKARRNPKHFSKFKRR